MIYISVIIKSHVSHVINKKRENLMASFNATLMSNLVCWVKQIVEDDPNFIWTR